MNRWTAQTIISCIVRDNNTRDVENPVTRSQLTTGSTYSARRRSCSDCSISATVFRASSISGAHLREKCVRGPKGRGEKEKVTMSHARDIRLAARARASCGFQANLHLSRSTQRADMSLEITYGVCSRFGELSRDFFGRSFQRRDRLPAARVLRKSRARITRSDN